MKSAEQRKAASHAIIKAHGVAWNPHLPLYHEPDAVVTRTPEETHARMAGLFTYFMRGQFAIDNVDYSEFEEFRPSFGVASLSPDERTFVDDRTPDQKQVMSSSWAIEGVVVLLWSLNLVQGLQWPEGICNLNEAIDLVRKNIKPANVPTLRSHDEIFDQADLYYRLLWACRDAMLARRPEPKGVVASVVFERRRALGWLTDTEDWDDVDMSS